mgnify:FL=1|tara:strand:+ start:348 stop:1544 length:1197 start_codon:yes stop_codon:yes gene_type:complete
MDKHLSLFVEINGKNYIFVVGLYDENQNFEIVEKIVTPCDGISNNKFVDIEAANEIVKNNIEIIENKLNHIFKDVIVVLGNFDCSCINISGFKRLNGSQVLRENISYIINSLKLAVNENEKQKSILHIFNSKSVLDGTKIENLPIGLFGDFYSHELSFFLINNNSLKNIKKIFNKNNLNIKKFILKQFVEGSQLINNNKDVKNFFKIRIDKDRSNVNFFENDAFRYSESFDFGTNIIIKDIQKICNLKMEEIVNFLSKNNLNKKDLNKNDLIEKDYFFKNDFRKIRKKLIFDIIEARIEDIVDFIFHKNINIKHFKKDSTKVYLTIADFQTFKSFEKNFKSFFLRNDKYDIFLIDDLSTEETITNVSNLDMYGWKTEAVPIVQAKNSLITRIFKSLFG